MSEPPIPTGKQTSESTGRHRGKAETDEVISPSSTACEPRGNQNWLCRSFAPRNKRFFKTKIAILIVAVLLAGRLIYVRVVYYHMASDLRKSGYVKHLIESYPFTEKWVLPSDPEKVYVRLYWYPRPPSSLFQKMDNIISRPALTNWNSWIGQMCLYLHMTFTRVTMPFLVPIDSRTGFDPNSRENVERALGSVVAKNHQ